MILVPRQRTPPLTARHVVERGDRTLSTAADLDHFGDVHEMVLDPLRTVETSH